jgi:hypothetical protein
VDRVEAIPAGRTDPEAGHHLVHDQQRAMLPGDLAQAGVEPGERRDRAHVPRSRLGDNAGDVVRVGGERGLHRGQVVVGDDDGLRRLRLGHPGRRRMGERGHP